MKRKAPCFLAFVLIPFLCLQSQIVLPNNLMGKREFEVNASFLGSNYSEIVPAEFICRFPVSRTVKIGGGAKLIFGGLNTSKTRWQPAFLVDIAKFIGGRQKWSINVQPGYEFYKNTSGIYSGYDPVAGPYDYYLKEKMGFYFLVGGNHRAIISKKFQLVTGIFNSFQDVRNQYFITYQSSPGLGKQNNDKKLNIGIGFKIGIIF